jgi:XRE family transcriptional regulator, aerobic/anaerobic benzoate catabolism transcriptional regulator
LSRLDICVVVLVNPLLDHAQHLASPPRGMTRKALALAADVSERHLANLEYGVGNASVLVLLRLSGALQCPLGELVGDFSTSSAEWLLLRQLLEPLGDAALLRVRLAVGQMLGTGSGPAAHSPRVALVGLRGAGKSALSQMLADDLGWPFVELSREIEALTGCSTAEIQALYGINAYRRRERRVLAQALQQHSEAVIATPGGLVCDPTSFKPQRPRSASTPARNRWRPLRAAARACAANPGAGFMSAL